MDPHGWPGVPYLEGSTEHRVPTAVDRGRRGPAGKEGDGFLNPAMSGNRTRSVLMLKHLANTSLRGVQKIQTIDSMCATGIRTRRWLNELPGDIASRLRVKMCDMNENALEWARSNLRNDPLGHNVSVIRGDARKELLSQGWHWIDIDPYGSPMPFLDLAMQATARRSVVSISATDTAALSGSSRGPLKRRYGAQVRLDPLKHDSGLRVLLGAAAVAAARHDRVITPLLSVWDSHHLRVTVLVDRSKRGANAYQDSIGWRVANPSQRDVELAIGAGLLPPHDAGSTPMHVMLPLSASPSDRSNVSGPLWTGIMGDAELMRSLSGEAASLICGSGDSALDTNEQKYARQSVRNIEKEANAIHGTHLVVTDSLPGFLGGGGPPSPFKMAEGLKSMGHSAEVSHYGEPSFRTDAPWSSVVDLYRNSV